MRKEKLIELVEALTSTGYEIVSINETETDNYAYCYVLEFKFMRKFDHDPNMRMIKLVETLKPLELEIVKFNKLSDIIECTVSPIQIQKKSLSSIKR